MKTVPSVDTSRHGRLFWAGVVVGGGVMAYGVAGLVSDISGDRLVNWVVFFVGADLLHDALVAPAVFGVGILLARFAPIPIRAPLQAALFASAVVLLVAGPPLAETAEFVGNPTIQPLDYPTAVGWALTIVWGTVFSVWGAWRLTRSLPRLRSLPRSLLRTTTPPARDKSAQASGGGDRAG